MIRTNLAVVTAFLVSSTAALAADPMRTAFEPKIQSLAKVLKARQGANPEVAPPQVVQRPNRPSGGEANVRLIVEELFRAAGVEVNPSATWGLRIDCKEGSLADPADSKNDKPVQTFVLQLAAPTGDDPAALSVTVPGIDSIVRVAAVCVDAKGEGSTAAVDAKVIAALTEKPTVFVKDSAVRAAEDSPYQVELLIDGKAVPIENRDGLAFAKLPLDKPFAIRLKNNSPLNEAVADRLKNNSPMNEAVADVRLDGVSAFEFTTVRKDNRPAYTYFVIPPRKTVDVKGWHKDHKTSYDFRVKTFAKSAAGELKLDPAVTQRTIAVYFSLAWEKNGKRPQAEPAHPMGDPGFGIGRGLEIDNPTEVAERSVGYFRTSVVIRYDVPTK